MHGSAHRGRYGFSVTTVQQRVPDFIGIGAQRAGTTWLHRHLSRHRDTFLFRAFKEVHYFDVVHLSGSRHRSYQSDRLAEWKRRLESKGQATPELVATLDHLRAAPRDDDWYRRLFGLAPAHKLCGEITPAYSVLSDDAVAHMLRLNPDVKFILLLRHPIERAWSNVRLDLKPEFQAATDPRDVDVSEERLRSMVLSRHNRLRTDYPAMIDRFGSAVDPSQFMVAFHDRIAQKPVALLREVARFLDLDPDRLRLDRLDPSAKRNKAPQVAMPGNLARELAALYRGDVQWLEDHVPGVPTDWLSRLDAYAGA